MERIGVDRCKRGNATSTDLFLAVFLNLVGVGSLSFSWCHIGPLAIEVASSVLVMGEPVMTSFPVTPLRKQWTAWGSRMIAIKWVILFSLRIQGGLPWWCSG